MVEGARHQPVDIDEGGMNHAVSSWFSLIWMLAAYVVPWTIVRLPLSFWMFDMSAAVAMLGRV